MSMFRKISFTSQAKEIGKQLEQIVGRNLTVHELWQIVKLCKLCRRSCRHNTAFNAAMSAAFPYAQFQQVQKFNKVTNKTYEGLKITVAGETVGDSNDDASEDEE